jgi:Na+-translocating ferredoxin:NAD+ oxidoreductase subunit C
MFEFARSFKNGIHPEEHKDQTSHLPIERMPFVDRYVLPLGQHLGAPSKAVVRVGEAVLRGQVIAEPGGFVSTTLHSPVQGKVVAIGKRRQPNGAMGEAIEIEIDRWAAQLPVRLPPQDWKALTAEQFVQQVQRAGLVGMGGASFPSHVKYSPPKGKTCETLVINGCECEPYLTCDHRVMLERPEAVLRGVQIALAKLGAKRAIIGVELNKQDAIDALRKALPAGVAIEVMGLQVKYPQGAEKMLIHAALGQTVPAGKLPIDLGIVVNNVATAAAMADYFDTGMPLIERVLTVAGSGITRPANLIVPIGTSVREVLRYCGGLSSATEKVVMGGPMMGTPLASIDVPVLKGTSGLLAFTAVESFQKEEHPCIKCGRCLEACANRLNPSRLARLARAGMYEEMEPQHVMDCMECGGCSFACPSGIPIVQLIRAAKGVLRERKAK